MFNPLSRKIFLTSRLSFMLEMLAGCSGDKVLKILPQFCTQTRNRHAPTTVHLKYEVAPNMFDVEQT